jgi:hypothetical protein
MFLLQNACSQSLSRIVGQNRNGSLRYNGAAVRACIHKVNRTSCDLHSILERLSLRIYAAKRRAKRWMYIDDSVRES